MIRIGIVGSFLKTASIMSEIFIQNYKTYKIINYNQFFNIIQSKYDIILIGISAPYVSSKYINRLKLNILIINETDEPINLSSPNLIMENKSIILINSDKTNIIGLKELNPSYIITFGFNSKNTITISSVKQGTYHTFQFCIQRSIKTISEKIIYEQEFLINTKYNDIVPVLSAIIVSIICDMDTSILKFALT